MKVLDLFSGIGGFSVGLERAGFETVAFCEIEDYPRAVLRKHWPDTPIYNDIRQLTAEQLRADGIVPDLICGGYPCQPMSVAGKQLGEKDERYLFPEVLRLVRSIRPRWCIFENVSGHIKLGYDDVAASLENEGYSVWTFVIPACAVNARHRRDRLWIVAHTRDKPRGDSIGRCATENGEWRYEKGKRSIKAAKITGSSETSKIMAYTDNAEQRASGRTIQRNEWHDTSWGCENIGEMWAVEPNVGRMVDGLRYRSHRIKGLGNAVVPQIPEMIGHTIMRYEAERWQTS